MPRPGSNRAFNLGHYFVGKTIGQGTFGKVKLGTHIATGQKVAVKILEKAKIKDSADVTRVSREIKILRKLRHPHVVQLYEIIETPKQLFLIMEYAAGGELFNYIVKRKKVKEPQACQFFQQIVAGLEYLHQNGIMHRDLKPENLLLDEHNNIKIVDFGLSNTYTSGELLKTACGSPCYAAPEMIAGKRYSPVNADIWSLGIILYALICGYLPFEDPNTSKLYKKIMSGEFKCPKWISNDSKDLLGKVLNTNPQVRYSFGQIKTHPWFNMVKPRIVKEHALIDEEVLQCVEAYGFDPEATRKALTDNKHNQVTTTYNLLLQKKRKSSRPVKTFELRQTEQLKEEWGSFQLPGHKRNYNQSVSPKRQPIKVSHLANIVKVKRNYGGARVTTPMHDMFQYRKSPRLNTSYNRNYRPLI